ncbi:O-antigen ligase family protein [uncultured Alsobacter sp.]|uniref:O-antigen ligase family protein n=1 Tax=uncultured Alsobacter sp. TaxID=1748258 RepID=UPI0025FA74E9|nr:O-antigen ligase family protein [uncultured Alsobacter sp.]
MTSLGQVRATPARSDRMALVAFTILALALPVAMMTYRSLPLLMAVAAALFLLASRSQGHGAWRTDRILTVATAAFFAVAAVTLAWTPEKPEAAEVLAVHVGLPVLLGLWLAGQPRPAVGGAWLVLLPAGLMLAAVILFVEMRTGLVLHRLARANLNPSKMNQATVVAVLWLWPVALIAARTLGRVAAGVLVAAVALAVFASESETAKLALIVGLAAGLVFLLRWRWLVAALAVAVALFVMMQPFWPTILDNVLSQSALDALQQGHARERLVIWRSFAAAVGMKPIFGFGFDSSGTIGFGPLLSLFPEALRVGIRDSHPHNMALQIWVELGVVGAALAAFALARATLLMGRHTPSARAAAAACIGSALLVAAVGYGAWQAWWVTALAMLPVLLKLADPQPDEAA